MSPRSIARPRKQRLRAQRWLLHLPLAILLTLPALGEEAPANQVGKTLPALAGEPDVNAALAYMARPPCTNPHESDPALCRLRAALWPALGASAVGADPAAWPDADHSLVKAILATPDEFVNVSGDPVRSYALVTIALEASGIDPRSVPLADGTTRDVVADLLAQYSPSTGFGSNTVVNEWALFGLNAAGYLGPEADSAVRVVVANQGPDGGLVSGFANPNANTAADYEVDVTAWGIMAVSQRGQEMFLERALDFLASAQLPSSCWPQFAGVQPDTADNAEATAAVLGALGALKLDPLDWSVSGRSPMDCLRGLQRTDGDKVGSFWDPGLGLTASTAQCLLGLAWMPLGGGHGPNARELRTLSAQYGSRVTLVPEGFVRSASDSSDPEPAPGQVDATQRGNTTYVGASWVPAPHPVEVVLQVPMLPAAPLLSVAGRAEAGDTLAVRVAPTDWWARSVALRLPDGRVLSGLASRSAPATFEVRLDSPGEATLTAWARNQDRESGPATASTVEVSAPPGGSAPPPEPAPSPSEGSESAAEDGPGPLAALDLAIDFPAEGDTVNGSVELQGHAVDSGGLPVRLDLRASGHEAVIDVPASGDWSWTLPGEAEGTREVTVEAVATTDQGTTAQAVRRFMQALPEAPGPAAADGASPPSPGQGPGTQDGPSTGPSHDVSVGVARAEDRPAARGAGADVALPAVAAFLVVAAARRRRVV